MKKICSIAGLVVTIEYQFLEYFEDNLDAYETTLNPEYDIASKVVEYIPLLEEPFMSDQYRKFFKRDYQEIIQVVNKDNVVKSQIIRDTLNNQTIISQVLSLTKNPSEMEYILISMAFLEYASLKGFLALHASSVVIDNFVYLFSAPSQTGKLTHADNFIKQFKNAFILNDDKPLIKDNIVYGTPFSGKEKKNRNVSFPIKAIYFIKQGNKDEIKKLTSEKSTPLMIKNILRPSDTQTWEIILPNINRIIREIPIFEAQLTLNKLNVHMTYFEPNKEIMMKIKDGFVVKEVGNQYMVLPVGEGALNFNGIMTLNKTGKFLFELLQENRELDELLECVLDKFEVDIHIAKKDIIEFTQSLQNKGLLE